MGGCLFNFHDLAAQIDRAKQEKNTAERVAAVDVAAVDLPPVSLDEGPSIETGGDEEVEVELDPFDDPKQEQEIENSMMELEVPDCGGGIPGDHCSF